MKVAAFDPAIGALGYALLWVNPEDATDVELQEFGTLKTTPHRPEGERLLVIRRWLESWLESRQPGIVAIERPQFFFGSHGNTGRSAGLAANALPLGMAYGVIVSTCEAAGVRVIEYPPQVIKGAVTGNGRAEKPAIRRAIKDRFGQALKGPDDGFDAIAIGLTYALGLAVAEQEGRETKCRLRL